jgi:hypothetical protein
VSLRLICRECENGETGGVQGGWVDRSQVDPPTGEKLKAVVRGSPDTAVGAGGTIIEY